jgi:hypothetical protein
MTFASAVLLFSSGRLSVRRLPILLVDSLRPAPKATLAHNSGITRPQLFVKIDRVAGGCIDDHHCFVVVIGQWILTCDLRRQICGGDLRLTYCHVSHLWSGEVHTVADCVHSINSDHSHLPIDVDVAIFTCDPES